MSNLITTSLWYPKHYYFFFIYLVGLTPQSSWEGGSTPHAARAIEVVSESLDQKHMRPDVSHNSRNQWWCPGFAPTVFATATPAAEVAMCDSTYYIFLILLGWCATATPAAEVTGEQWALIPFGDGSPARQAHAIIRTTVGQASSNAPEGSTCMWLQHLPFRSVPKIIKHILSPHTLSACTSKFWLS